MKDASDFRNPILVYPSIMAIHSTRHVHWKPSSNLPGVDGAAERVLALGARILVGMVDRPTGGLVLAEDDNKEGC